MPVRPEASADCVQLHIGIAVVRSMAKIEGAEMTVVSIRSGSAGDSDLRAFGARTLSSEISNFVRRASLAVESTDSSFCHVSPTAMTTLVRAQNPVSSNSL